MKIPLEILGEIVQFLEFEELKSMSLTSRLVVKHCQQELFKEIAVNEETEVGYIVEKGNVFLDSPHLGTYVKELEYEFTERDLESSDDVCRFLTAFTGLQRVTFNFKTREVGKLLAESSLKEPLLAILGLLTLQELALDNAPMLLLSLLSSTITWLRVASSDEQDVDLVQPKDWDPGNTLSVPPKLHHFINDGRGNSLRWLLALDEPDRRQRIDISQLKKMNVIPGPDIDRVTTLANKLEYVVYEIEVASAISGLPNIFKLSSETLNHLAVSFSTLESSAQRTCFRELANQFSLVSLEALSYLAITVDLYIADAEALKGSLRKLDKAIGSRARFPKLKEVQVYVTVLKRTRGHHYDSDHPESSSESEDSSEEDNEGEDEPDNEVTGDESEGGNTQRRRGKVDWEEVCSSQFSVLPRMVGVFFDITVN